MPPHPFWTSSKILDQYQKVLIKEIMWYKKSRSKWLMVSECNKKYFHDIAAIQRKWNKVNII